MQIRAIAIKSGYTSSQEVSGNYNITGGTTGQPWVMVFVDLREDPRSICEADPGTAITYYTDPAVTTLVNNTLLYIDSALTMKAEDGYYFDVNDRMNYEIWRVDSRSTAPGLLKATEFTCRL